MPRSTTWNGASPRRSASSCAPCTRRSGSVGRAGARSAAWTSFRPRGPLPRRPITTTRLQAVELGLGGKKAVVTGASRGLGRAIALELAGEGCDLAVCARGEADLAAAVDELEGTGVGVFSQMVDVTRAAEVAGFVAGAAAALGGIDVLVNNAGGATPGN